MKISPHYLLKIMILVIITISCHDDRTKDDRQIKDFFNGITGTWQVEDQNSFEEWTLEEDSLFTALAYALDNGDTLASEHIRIIRDGKDWFYEARVEGQNQGQPVRFRLVEQSDSVMTFRNETHDFPQTIRYARLDKDHVRATITGTINKEEKSYEFNYIRYMKKKKVTGVGGIFFTCDDPEKMREWYGENLGLATNEYGSLFEFRLSDEPEKKGYLQWSPFSKNTRYFEPSEKDFMINFRVENIEELVEELRRSGVTVLDTIESFEYGKFVHILDPENNKIELWEPADEIFTKLYEGKTTK